MRADRLLSILLRLQAHRHVTAKQLAQELEVSPRTIYRDIEALSMAGIPVYTQRGEYGGCYLDEGYQISLTDLMLPEIQALFIQGGSTPLEALDMDWKVKDGLLKLIMNLPTYQQEEIKALQQRLFIDTRNWTQINDDAPFLNHLQSATWQNQILAVSYEPFNKPLRQYRIEPYGLVVKAHMWYLVARVEGKSDFQMYRVSRFKDVHCVDKTFVREKNFNLRSKWLEMSDSFENNFEPDYLVTFKISKHLAYALEFFIPNRYRIIGEEDNTFILEAQFYSVNEARPIIMGFGHFVEVITPDDLINDIKTVAQSIINKYR